MASRVFATMAKIDLPLVVVVLTLSLFGLLNLAGISTFSKLFVKQAVFIAAGLAVFVAFAALDYRLFRSSRFSCFFVWGVGVALLAFTVLFGSAVRGAMNWLYVGPLSISPIEVVKFGALLVLAQYFAREHRGLVLPTRILLSSLVVVLPIALTIFQPDLGSAMVLASVWFLMVVLLGVPLRTVAVLLVGAAAISVLSWDTLLHDYQKMRILSFLFPERDPLGAAYQSSQAEVAVGAGGLWGRGFFAADAASRLAFLPESASDFAFASIAEKTGFVGVLVMLFAFAFLLYRIHRVALRATNNFSCAYALGLFVMMATEIIINIGMNLRLLPVTGLPLPFVSYGGSHILVLFSALGLLESVRLHQPEFAQKDHEALTMIAS